MGNAKKSGKRKKEKVKKKKIYELHYDHREKEPTDNNSLALIPFFDVIVVAVLRRGMGVLKL
jgi:hypothetical protein